MTPALKIAIESTVLLKGSRTGLARYASGLLEGFDALAAAGENIAVTRLCKLSRWGLRHRLPALGSQNQKPWHPLQPAFLRRFDVVHAATRWLPPWPQPLRVATIHDVYASIGINYDDPVERARQIAYDTQIARGAQCVICVSQCTRRDFLAHFPFDPAHAHVVHLGVDERFCGPRLERARELRERLCAGEPFLLSVASFRANKNLERLIQAYARCGVRDRYRLLIGGYFPPKDREKLMQLALALGIGERVSVPGYLKEADIPDLYAAASGFLFPSLYEGFGLPILEAMATGTPVLTSTAGSCPEAANGHAILVDPESIEDIGRGIEACVAMPADRIERARAYAHGKTWAETARQTLAVYRAEISQRAAR